MQRPPKGHRGKQPPSRPIAKLPSQTQQSLTRQSQSPSQSRLIKTTANARKSRRSWRFPWQKPKNTWFGQDHPTQRRTLKQAQWFPSVPAPEPAPKKAKKPFKLELRYRPWMSSVSSVLLVLGIGGAVTGFGWLSVQFLMNPKSIVWVNSYLPKPLQIKISGWDQPYTLAEIQTQLKVTGLSLGDQVRLADARKSEILLPVLQTDQSCVGAPNVCTKVVELRVYRPTQHPYKTSRAGYFQLVEQLPVAGIEDWFIQEPFVNAQVDVPPPSDYLLGFSEVVKLEQRAPQGGIWLTLRGSRSQFGTYGQILLYNPKNATLTAMVPWSSPNGELPQWQNVASGGTSELVVDQTIGLETLYQVYSLQPDSKNASGLTLRQVQMDKPAIDSQRFQDALELARSGLWSLALQQLDALGKETFAKNSWAALQRDTIAYHAKTFKAQAERESASTSQQVQANLLDGRWEKAIQAVKAVPDDRQDVIELLNADSGQLLKRLQTALKMTPGNNALQAWNAAMRLARNGQADTIAWLKQQAPSSSTNRFIADLAPTLRPTPKPSPSPTSKPDKRETAPSAKPPQKREPQIPSWWQAMPVRAPQVAPPPPVATPSVAPSPSPSAQPTPAIDSATPVSDPVPAAAPARTQR